MQQKGFTESEPENAAGPFETYYSKSGCTEDLLCYRFHCKRCNAVMASMRVALIDGSPIGRRQEASTWNAFLKHVPASIATQASR